jgi:hypothetical protein
MNINSELLDLYRKSRQIRQAIQYNVRNKLDTKILVEHDTHVSERIKLICSNERIRLMYRYLAIALDNEDYETSEILKNRIETI